MIKTVLVTTKENINEFLEFPSRLLKNDKNYIRPLDKDVEEVFNPKKNKFFRGGSCERFLFQQNGKTVGRVAVFVNAKYKQEQPTGGFGFFDCEYNQELANFIFDHCKSWLEEKGMQAMDGPINFGERDKFWGLLIEGFTEPLYGMNFNPPYYKELFENYGFQIYFNQLCFSRAIHDNVSEVFTKMHHVHSKNPDISAKPLQKNNLEKFAKDFTIVYNKAWASHGGGKQMEESKTLKMFKTMKLVLNDDISWFIYHKDEPIAMWMNIPDLNQWFKYLNGKFGWWEKIKFILAKTFTKNKKMVGLVFGIVPEWQKKGIDGYMIWEGTQHIRKNTKFEITELQWIGDFNPKMIKIAQSLDTEVTRKLATYRFHFYQNKEFVRHQMLS